MEEQLDGLREMVQGGLTREEEDFQAQMKELYDCLEQEDNERNAEYERLKQDFIQVNELLDSYGIKKCGTLLERIKIALRLVA